MMDLFDLAKEIKNGLPFVDDIEEVRIGVDGGYVEFIVGGLTGPVSLSEIPEIVSDLDHIIDDWGVDIVEDRRISIWFSIVKEE